MRVHHQYFYFLMTFDGQVHMEYARIDDMISLWSLVQRFEAQAGQLAGSVGTQLQDLLVSQVSDKY